MRCGEIGQGICRPAGLMIQRPFFSLAPKILGGVLDIQLLISGLFWFASVVHWILPRLVHLQFCILSALICMMVTESGCRQPSTIYPTAFHK